MKKTVILTILVLIALLCAGCGYPGYPHVIIARNYGDSTWEEFGRTEESRVIVTLNKKGKYKANIEAYLCGSMD